MNNDNKRMIERGIAFRDDTATIDIWYPTQNDIKFIEVGLMDARAADNIRCSYDFNRDGWKIEQASKFEWEENEDDSDSDWQEVAFIKAWGRDRRKQ